MGAGCVTFDGLMINSRSRLKSPITWTRPLLAGALLLTAATTPAAPPARGTAATRRARAPAPRRQPAAATGQPRRPPTTPSCTGARSSSTRTPTRRRRSPTSASTSRAPQPDLDLDLPKVGRGRPRRRSSSRSSCFPKAFKPAEFYGEALRQIDAVERVARANPQRLRVARTAAEVRANATAGILSALLGVEGGHVLGPGDRDDAARSPARARRPRRALHDADLVERQRHRRLVGRRRRHPRADAVRARGRRAR